MEKATTPRAQKIDPQKLPGKQVVQQEKEERRLRALKQREVQRQYDLLRRLERRGLNTTQCLHAADSAVWEELATEMGPEALGLEEEGEGEEEGEATSAALAGGGGSSSPGGSSAPLQQLTEAQIVFLAQAKRKLMVGRPMSASHAQAVPSIPEDLVKALRSGSCVAFVGAGFTAGLLPLWRSLLDRLVEELPASYTDPASKGVVNLRGELKARRDMCQPDIYASLIKNAFEQVLAASTTPEERERYNFARVMERQLASPVDLGHHQDMKDRLRLLSLLPLRGIITTNFDPFLKGRTPFDKDIKLAYKALLRTPCEPPENGQTEGTFKTAPDGTLVHSAHRPIIQLHGRVGADYQGSAQGAGADSSRNPFVFSKSEYNSAIFGNPANKVFLQSVFATHTVLFLGFSFTDHYIDQLLDETVHLFCGA
jgi:hypothetical protein